MKKILLAFYLICSLSTVAQNYFVPHTLNVPPLPSPTYQIEWADVDLNGYKDLITANQYTHELLVYPNTAGVVDSVPFSYPGNIEKFWLTDWNHDNRMDVIAQIPINPGYQLILNNPAGGFFPPVSFTNLPPGELFDIKDVNANNFPD